MLYLRSAPHRLLDDGHSVVLDFGDVGRPGERATAASVSRSGEAIHTTERLALRRLEVMTRAVWEGGPPTPFSRNTQYGDCAHIADC
jgi:hypothetical protein